MEVCVELLIIKKTPQLAKNNAWTDALKNFGVFWGRSLKDVCTVLHPLPEGRPMPDLRGRANEALRWSLCVWEQASERARAFGVVLAPHVPTYRTSLHVLRPKALGWTGGLSANNSATFKCCASVN